MNTTEQIHWVNTGKQLPDDNTTVLVILKNENEPCWPAYVEGGRWFYADGSPIDNPVWWTHMPVGPGSEHIETSPGEKTEIEALRTLIADIKAFDIQNYQLDLPQHIRARIERALL
jgi:hypothetical protein